MKSQKNKAPYWRQMSPEGYLINLTDGSTEWYHVTATGCSFEPGHLTYLCSDKQYLLGEANAIFNDEDRELGRAHICKVRVRGLKWSDVFDIADYLETGGGEYSVVNARGKALEEKYNCRIPTSYHYMDHESMGACNPLKMGFKAWLEDEGVYWPENPRGYWPETLVVATGDGVEIEIVDESLIERVGLDWVLKERENPDREWYDTQSLQNDTDGYLVNPDTGGTHWYHGSKYGALKHGGGVIYLTSDIDTAYQFACMDRPLFDNDSWEGSVFEIKVKIPARDILDIRRANTDPRTRRFAETLGISVYSGNKDDLHFENYDAALGNYGGAHRNAAAGLGFRGWLEVEHTAFSLGVPCSVGLFTDLGRDAYEIVHEWQFGVDECIHIELRENPQNLPIHVNNLGVHTNAPISVYMGASASSASRKQGCSDIRVRTVNKISAEQRRRNPNSQTGSEGYTLTIEQEPYRTVLNWRLEGDDRLCAQARIVFDKDNVESILESQVSGAVRDLAYAEDLSDDVLCGLQDEAIAYVTNDLEYETPVYLSKIEVLSEGDRGKGLGTDLMRELELYLQGEGIDTIYLQAVPSQRSAWYQRLGFEIIYPSSRDIQRGLVYPLLKKMLY